MTLQLLHFEFPYEENLIFFFIRVVYVLRDDSLKRMFYRFILSTMKNKDVTLHYPFSQKRANQCTLLHIWNSERKNTMFIYPVHFTE
jgi:hypothetical protein